MPRRDRRVLVDASTLDDAGVFAHGRGEALIQTLDFFTPIVDDPYDFGQVAAANAVSDVYAMGGRPLTALAMLCAPEGGASAEVIAAILQGGLDKMHEAGVSVVGGHSVRDAELKFGYSVTGVARRRQLLRNSSARRGDHLFLTKPLGTGILATALKQSRLDEAHTRRLTRHLVTLNRAASEIAVEFGARAATDVTGFGLLGHASQLADASDVSLVLRPTAEWLMTRVREYVIEGVVPGGLARNREFYGPGVDAGDTPAELLAALFDPQTSGGLLVAVSARKAAGFAAALKRRRVWHVQAGEVVARGEKAVRLRAEGQLA